MRGYHVASMSFTCPYCGAELEDPGGAFVAHLQESDACRTPWEFEAESAAEDASRH